jgi:DNA-binding NarL/FixJ family response regulator
VSPPCEAQRARPYYYAMAKADGQDAPAEYSVLIVDDEPEFRSWLRQNLEGSSLMRVVGEASNATDALDLVSSEQPQVVVADVHMPGQDGFDLARSIRQANPEVRVVLVSSRSEAAYTRVAEQEQALFLPKLGLSATAILSALAGGTGR